MSAEEDDELVIAFDIKGWSSVEGTFTVQSSNAAFDNQAISYSNTWGEDFASKSVKVTLTKIILE